MYVDPHRPVAFEEHALDEVLLADLHPPLAGVLEQHLVELAARHLEGPLRLAVRAAVEIDLAGAVVHDELETLLLDVIDLVELVEDPEVLEDGEAEGGDRLADVEAGELGALEDEDLAPSLSEPGAAGRTRGTAANDHDVVSLFHEVPPCRCRPTGFRSRRGIRRCARPPRARGAR